MAINIEAYQQIILETSRYQATLVAVSKFKPIEDIQAMYDLGQRDFGENFVQELLTKYEALPKDIRWHFIGHLQRNKVRYIAPFIYLVHGVDSEKLLAEINKEAQKNNHVINCLLQMHIAEEETKFGFSETELTELSNRIFHTNILQYPHVVISGLMGMASFSDDQHKVRNEFKTLKQLHATLIGKFPTLNPKPGTLNALSMGMSNDYKLALEEGSTMIRIGSLLFGTR